MAGKFELKKTTNSQYMFNLKASNGEIILTSETYIQKQGAQNGISSVKINAPYDFRYEKKSSGSQFYFVLKGMNNEIIGTSELYTSIHGMEKGITAVKNYAPTADTIDLTY